MFGTMVKGGAVILAATVLVEPAEAQRLQFGVSVRVSDNVVASVGYGHRHPIQVMVYGDDYRHRRIKRHRKAHRKLERQHDRFHRELEHEHDELHYELDHHDPVTARRLHRQWHRDAASDHDHVHHGLGHEHNRVHKKLRKGGKRKHRR